MHGMRAGIAMAAALAVLAGCDGLGPDSPLEELRAAEARWTATTSGAYQVNVFRGCFCPVVTARITVVGGEITAVSFPDGLPDPSQEEWWRDYVLSYDPTVEEAFVRIRAAINSRPAGFSAQYDPGTGLPLDVSVDPARNVADDEWSMRFWDLVVSDSPGG